MRFKLLGEATGEKGLLTQPLFPSSLPKNRNGSTPFHCLIKNIATKLSGTAAFSRYWIGISDKDTEGTFKYASDASEVEFTSWRRGQPNNRWPKLDCTAFKNGEWNTANCENREFPYICQMDISEDDDNSDNAGESDEIDLASMINVLKAKLEEVEAKVEYNIEKIDEDKEKLDQLGAEVDFNSEKLRPF